MNIVVRLLVGTGLFVFGYYLGREVTRGEFIRKGLENQENVQD
ncbi:MAG: hypothetical protein R3308_01420 [Thiohalobacterales bacterium]|nr:hypothetical protein [Thiohalobacterales bacterium]